MRRLLLMALLTLGFVFINVATVSFSAEAVPGIGGGFFFDATSLSFTGVVRLMLGTGIAGGHFDIIFPQSPSLPVTFIPSIVVNAPFNLAPGIMLVPYVGIGPVIRIPPPFFYPPPYLQAKIGDLLAFFGFGMYIEIAFRVLPAPLGFQGVGFGLTADF
ncbi:hypothetical protein HYR54_17795 [Candidatus Acetothermia bacterium]|nr:hypothetical protein [Candidatus Acetothermia bacterium]MBI3459437.1 hypothetical protein [Candidatus Acetothermia bacterium]MBI3659915.1 hypothetical protein [Candidatus Acetothermia bacterium]